MDDEVPLLTQEEIAHFKREGETERERAQRERERQRERELVAEASSRLPWPRAGYVIKYGLLDPKLMRKMRAFTPATVPSR